MLRWILALFLQVSCRHHNTPDEEVLNWARDYVAKGVSENALWQCVGTGLTVYSARDCTAFYRGEVYTFKCEPNGCYDLKRTR